MKRKSCDAIKVLVVLLFLTAMVQAQTTAFTYQGRLTDGANLANGNYDFEFKLFDAVSGGAQQGATLQQLGIAVVNGIFTVQLDFGANFPGANRWLEIGVRAAGGGSFTTLTPRQPVTSTPYAVRSQNATAADGLSVACVNCVTSSQIESVQGSQVTGAISGTQISGTIPVESLPTGSGNYIQNAATLRQQGKNSLQQVAAFDIDGDGAVGGTLSGSIVNATAQFNLGGIRILSNAGQRNLFAGESAGQSNSGDGSNAFFGYHAGMNNTTGVRNNFFGSVAGENNTIGFDNNFFGDSAGRFNTIGARNSYYGSFAGQNNSFGADNAFFGYQAGLNTLRGANSFFGSSSGAANTIGLYNAFFGYFAGANTTTGVQNTFIGASAGEHNQTGGYNTFVGYAAGDTPTSGENNTALGFAADVLSGLQYATAIGSNAVARQTNTVILGRESNLGGTDFVGIGLSTPVRLLDVNGRARVRQIPLEASAATVCFNSAGDLLQCGASSLRFKQNVQPFSEGLDLIRQLRPISFTWKDGGAFDIGLAAEEVAQIAPFFSFSNDKGEITGVKYERLSMLFINAINEQQAQIEAQKQTIKQQQAQIERQQTQIEKQQHLIERQQQQLTALLTFLCKQHPQAEICQ